MEDAKINELLKEERYEEAIDLMQDKYVDLFDKMLKKKNIEKPNNKDFYCYTTKIVEEYPHLANHMDMLRRGIVNKDMSFLNEIELLKNTYKYFSVNY